MNNALLIPNLSTRAAEAKTQLALKLRGLLPPRPDKPRTIWKILRDSDAVIVDECLQLYEQLSHCMNGTLDTWLESVPRLWEHLGSEPARVWWLLNNKLQETQDEQPSAEFYT